MTSFLRYYVLIFSHALAASKSFFVSKLLLVFLIQLASSIAAWLIRGANLDWPSIASSIVQGLTGPLLLGFVLLFVNLARAPAAIYADQQHTINGLQSELSYRGRPIKIRLVAENPTTGDRDKWVCMRIHNDEDANLANCQAKLVHVAKLPGLEEVLSVPELLGWSASNPPVTGTQTVSRQGSLLVDIARCDHRAQRISFTTQRGDWAPSPPGQYSLRVTVWGDLQGLAIPPVDFKAVISYDGGVDLVIREAEDQAPNNSLEPTRDRRAKMDSGLADVATTRSRACLAGAGAGD